VKTITLLLYCLSTFLLSTPIRSEILPDKNAQTTQVVPEEHTSMDAPKEIQTNFKKEDFKPYMLDHFNEGCPTNSTCNKDMGKLYQKWMQTLSATSDSKIKVKKLEDFRKMAGIPFEIWLTQTDKHHPKLISWEGNCNYHNREGHKKIKMGISFISNIDDLATLEKDKVISIRKLYRLNSNTNKIIRYQTPQADTPLYVNGDDLIYQRSESGIYYGISISPEGYLSIVDTLTPLEYPESIPCPKTLKQAQIDHPEDFETEIYAGVYCQKTWNSQSKDFDILLLGWSCD